MAKRLNVELDFNANTGRAKSQIQELQQILSQLALSSSGKLGFTAEIDEAVGKVSQLQAILKTASTSTGELDLHKFNDSLAKSAKSMADTKEILAPRGEKLKFIHINIIYEQFFI